MPKMVALLTFGMVDSSVKMTRRADPLFSRHTTTIKTEMTPYSWFVTISVAPGGTAAASIASGSHAPAPLTGRMVGPSTTRMKKTSLSSSLNT